MPLGTGTSDILFCNASIGVPAAMRPTSGTLMAPSPSPDGAARTAAAARIGGHPRFAAHMPAGAHALRLAARGGGAQRVGHIVGQFDDLERAGALFHAAQEAAFLQRRDEAMDARFGLQIERVLHLVETTAECRFRAPARG